MLAPKYQKALDLPTNVQSCLHDQNPFAILETLSIGYHVKKASKRLVLVTYTQRSSSLLCMLHVLTSNIQLYSSTIRGLEEALNSGMAS